MAGQEKSATMLNDQYIQLALKTEASAGAVLIGLTESKVRLLHAALGLASEAGELADQIKGHVFYGKKLDGVNVEEEIGDLFWYLAVLFDELGANSVDVMAKNIAKLKARYGEKFSEESAVNRNLETERKVLENDYRDPV